MAVETVWKSGACAPSGDPFLSIKKVDGWYLFAERAGKDSVAFILMDEEKGYGLIRELKPPLKKDDDVYLTTAFGGSIDREGEDLVDLVRREVEEEAGYQVDPDRILFAGKTMVSTQMNQICHLFLVDVTEIPKTLKTEAEIAREENGSREFIGNEVVWMSAKGVLENQDWKSIFIVARTFGF